MILTACGPVAMFAKVSFEVPHVTRLCLMPFVTEACDCMRGWPAGRTASPLFCTSSSQTIPPNYLDSKLFVIFFEKRVLSGVLYLLSRVFEFD